MANVKITDLAALTNPASTDVLPIVDVNTDATKKVSVGEIVGKISGDVDVATDGTSSIAAGVIVDADVNANAEIAVSKLADGAARQLLQTDAAGTGVEWTDNVDVPGTLDVTGATTLDSTLGVDGQSTLASAAVSDLTEDRVVIAGASGELEDSTNLTFDGSELGITGTLDVSSDATVGGDLTVTGDLTVEGTTTTIETATLLVEDKNIEMGVVDTPSDATADGGGLTLKGSTDKTINWVNATDAWTSSEHIELASGKEFYIDGNGVLNATTLGSGVVNSSLTSVGTIATGTWQGTAIDDTYIDTISTAGKVSNTATTATDANTASAIVARDASGDFTAGTITADLTGNADTATALETARDIGGVSFDGTANINLPGVNTTGNQDTSGNAATATKLNSNRTFAVTGDVTGTVSSDLTSGASIATSIASGVIVDGDVNASAAIAGTKIDPDFGSQTVETTGVFSAAGGAEATPSIAFTGDLDTGIYSPGADQVAISTNGSGRLFVDASGNVGIESSSPAAKLDVNGDGGASLPAISAGTAGIARRTATAASFCAFSIIAGTASSSRLNFGDTDDEDTGSIRYLHTDNSFQVFTNATEKLRITSDGKVGIGTTSPGSALEIDAAAATSPFIAKINTSEAARIDSSGRLLIGTSSSSLPTGIQIQGYAGGSTGQGILTLSRGSALPIANTTIGDIRFYDNGSGFGAKIEAETDGPWASSDYPGRLVFSVTADGASSPTEALRISNDRSITVSDGGDVVLGTTTGTKIGTATSQKIGFYNATPVVQPTAVADITTTATSGSLPTPDGSVTISDATTPTVTELLEYCVELEAKLEAALGHLRTLGLIAT